MYITTELERDPYRENIKREAERHRNRENGLFSDPFQYNSKDQKVITPLLIKIADNKNSHVSNFWLSNSSDQFSIYTKFYCPIV